MSKPFFERLQKYFSAIGDVLQGRAEAASIFPNATDIGISRERIYADVLRLHLPSNTNTSFGGFLFDLDGNESNQIDLIITNDISPQFNFHNAKGDGKTFACIDGCLAIASLKSNLTSPELIDALKNISSIPDKQPLTGRVNPLYKFDGYDDWPYKIIFATKGVSAETCYKTLTEFYATHPEIPLYKRPNLIHVTGKYWFFRLFSPSKSKDNKDLQIGDYVGKTEANDTFALIQTVLSIQKIAQHSNNILYSYDKLLQKTMNSS